ncbi:3-hexulose-6-phosphate synthase [Halobacillus mangrovi]|uniref:3-hexulose-6-phosphate synthase n=1 Tax=Halobacillus mangrovi TaxID=402384 RepID=A0A1W5ZXI2_9BACI|nr:3-hexulose-6-phosphate synthase [Halobacillus mangrovi]ARI77970.1 Fe-S cluster assembly protein HesB [Halobacillus mangrovi]
MNLQLALDRLDEETCLHLIEETYESIDWIEVGTGVIKEYGMEIIRKIRIAYPSCTIVADMKTCDAGRHEAAQAFEAGADITTVMAFSADQTISDTLKVARKFSGRIMVDLLGVQDQLRIHELANLGVDLVSLHFGKDMQEQGGFDVSAFQLTKDYPDLDVAVAGGINEDILSNILTHQPDAVIVGSAITKSSNPKQTAIRMKERMNEYEADDSHGVI